MTDDITARVLWDAIHAHAQRVGDFTVVAARGPSAFPGGKAAWDEAFNYHHERREESHRKLTNAFIDATGVNLDRMLKETPCFYE